MTSHIFLSCIFCLMGLICLTRVEPVPFGQHCFATARFGLPLPPPIGAQAA
jgi:hypothetical protein